MRIGRDAIRQSGPLFFRSLQLSLQFVVFAFQRQQFFIQRNGLGASDLQIFRQFAAFCFLCAFFLQLFQCGLPFLQRLFKIGGVFLGRSQSRLEGFDVGQPVLRKFAKRVEHASLFVLFMQQFFIRLVQAIDLIARRFQILCDSGQIRLRLAKQIFCLLEFLNGLERFFVAAGSAFLQGF